MNRPGVAIALGLAIAGVVLIESTRAPWAPFFYFGALATIAIPFAACVRFGTTGQTSRRTLAIAMALALAGLLIVDVTATGPILDAVGKDIGVTPLSSAVDSLLAKASASQHMSKDSASAIYAVFYLIWAPFAEELFYRGYLRQALVPRLGEAAAALIGSALFALRHVPHLMFLGAIPWTTIAFWAACVFAGGLILNELVRRSGALWPAMVVHFIDNAVGLLV